MINPRWLALYVDQHGKPRASMIHPACTTDFPFGVDEFGLGLEDYDGEPVTFVEMPGDEKFRPIVVDNTEDNEIPMQFIDLA